MNIKTFAPNGSNTVQLVAGPASANVAIDANSNVVRVLNAGPDMAYIAFGVAGVTSTTARLPIPSGSTELFTKGSNGYVAAITDAAKSATLYFTSGEGI